MEGGGRTLTRAPTLTLTLALTPTLPLTLTLTLTMSYGQVNAIFWPSIKAAQVGILIIIANPNPSQARWLAGRGGGSASRR